ncbi:MAG: baseplate J/gp47 family protein [Spirochaetota bacterium]
MITIPTVSEIRDQILTDIESATGQSAPLLPRAVWRILATALAGAMALLYRFAAWAYRQIFTATSDDEALIRRAAEYGITRVAATRWIGTATATGTNGTTIPSGTTWTHDGNVYETTASATISSGVATINVRSLEGGSDVELSVSDTITLTSPISGVDADATVASVIQEAQDAEDLENLRSRLAARQANQPQGGALGDWVQWATEVAGIGEAIVERPEAGAINIYPLTDDEDPANRIPSGALLTQVDDYVSDPERSPIRAAAITVIAPTELDFDVDIANLSPNTAAVRATIESAIETYMYERRPKQYTDQVNDRSLVSAGEITGIAIDAGAQVATVTLKNAGGSTITSYTLDESELAVLRTLTWV